MGWGMSGSAKRCVVGGIIMSDFETRKTSIQDLIILLALSVIWGSAFGAIKIAVEGTGPFTVAGMRSVLALLAVAIYLGFRRSLIPPLKQLLSFRLVFVGITGTMAPFILISWAELHVASSLAGLLMASGPLITVLGGHYITGDEKLSLKRFGGVVLGFGGVALLFIDGIRQMGTSLFWAQFALIAAAGCYASSNLSVRPISHLPPPVIAGASFVISSLIAVPLAVIVEQPDLGAFSPEIWAALFWLGFVSTGLAFSLRYMLIYSAGAGFTSNVGYLIPMVAVLIGWLVLDEPVTLNRLVALVIIVASIIIAQRSVVMIRKNSRNAS